MVVNEMKIKLEYEKPKNKLAQTAGAAEYTDCISAEEKDYPNEPRGYDSK